jgi:hypothetical protein
MEKEKTIKILRRGTNVEIIRTKKTGYIHSATVLGTEIIYSITYFDKDSNNWLSFETTENQLKVLDKETEPQIIGFKSNDK